MVTGSSVPGVGEVVETSAAELISQQRTAAARGDTARAADLAAQVSAKITADNQAIAQSVGRAVTQPSPIAPNIPANPTLEEVVNLQREGILTSTISPSEAVRELKQLQTLKAMTEAPTAETKQAIYEEASKAGLTVTPPSQVDFSSQEELNRLAIVNQRLTVPAISQVEPLTFETGYEDVSTSEIKSIFEKAKKSGDTETAKKTIYEALIRSEQSVELDTGELVGRLGYDLLSSSDKKKLNEIGLKEFNLDIGKRQEEFKEQQEKVDQFEKDNALNPANSQWYSKQDLSLYTKEGKIDWKEFNTDQARVKLSKAIDVLGWEDTKSQWEGQKLSSFERRALIDETGFRNTHDQDPKTQEWYKKGWEKDFVDSGVFGTKGEVQGVFEDGGMDGVLVASNLVIQAKTSALAPYVVVKNGKVEGYNTNLIAYDQIKKGGSLSEVTSNVSKLGFTPLVVSESIDNALKVIPASDVADYSLQEAKFLALRGEKHAGGLLYRKDVTPVPGKKGIDVAKDWNELTSSEQKQMVKLFIDSEGDSEVIREWTVDKPREALATGRQWLTEHTGSTGTNAISDVMQSVGQGISLGLYDIATLPINMTTLATEVVAEKDSDVLKQLNPFVWVPPVYETVKSGPTIEKIATAVFFAPMLIGPIKGIPKFIKGQVIEAMPGGISKRATAIEIDVSRIPWEKASKEIGSPGNFEPVRALVAQALIDQVYGKKGQRRTVLDWQGLKREVIVQVGDTKIKVPYRLTPMQAMYPQVVYHATSDVTKFVESLRKDGKVEIEGNLYTSPQIAQDFARGSAEGGAPINPAVIAIHIKKGDIGTKFTPPKKQYKGAIEAEVVSIKDRLTLFPTEINATAKSRFGKTKQIAKETIEDVEPIKKGDPTKKLTFDKIGTGEPLTGETFTRYAGGSKTTDIHVAINPQTGLKETFALGKEAKITTNQKLPMLWMKSGADMVTTAPSIGWFGALKTAAFIETVQDIAQFKYRLNIKPSFDPFGRSGSSGPLLINSRKTYGKVKVLTKEIETTAMSRAEAKAGKGASKEKLAKEYDAQLKKLSDEYTQKLLRDPEIKKVLEGIDSRQFREAYKVNLAKAYVLYRQAERESSGETKSIDRMPVDRIDTESYRRTESKPEIKERIVSTQIERITEPRAEESKISEIRNTDIVEEVKRVPGVDEEKPPESREGEEPDRIEPVEPEGRKPDEPRPVEPREREPIEPRTTEVVEPRKPKPPIPLPKSETKEGIGIPAKVGTFAWRQGKTGKAKGNWYVLKWPYTQDELVLLPEAPKDAKIVKGADSARQSLQALGGPIPPGIVTTVDMGAMDVVIQGPREVGKKGSISFKPDKKTQTVSRLTTKNVRMKAAKKTRKSRKPKRVSNLRDSMRELSPAVKGFQL